MDVLTLALIAVFLVGVLVIVVRLDRDQRAAIALLGGAVERGSPQPEASGKTGMPGQR